MRVPAALLAAACSLAALAQDAAQSPVPKAQLHLITRVVSVIKDHYAGPVDETRLANGCASLVWDAAKARSGAAQAPTTLGSLPRVLQEAKRAAPDVEYEELAHACAKGMVGTLDKHSEFMDPSKFRELAGSSPSAATPW
jgi:hypothetical protein